MNKKILATLVATLALGTVNVALGQVDKTGAGADKSKLKHKEVPGKKELPTKKDIEEEKKGK
jgi:hypothetical protein